MSCEIRTSGGKLIGKISDSLDEEDYLIVDSAKVPLSRVYKDKELKDSFNNSIKDIKEEDEDNEDQ